MKKYNKISINTTNNPSIYTANKSNLSSFVLKEIKPKYEKNDFSIKDKLLQINKKIDDIEYFVKKCDGKI